jgi:pilus assembly protein CpaF
MIFGESNKKDGSDRSDSQSRFTESSQSQPRFFSSNEYVMPSLSPELAQKCRTFSDRLLASLENQTGLASNTPQMTALLTDRFEQLYNHEQLNLPIEKKKQLLAAVLDEVVGYGALGPLLRDIDISEVMVNGPNSIWVERKGKLIKLQMSFENEDQLMRIAQRIVRPLGRTVDRKRPFVDARLPDGSRVNIIIPPCALPGATFTIRKFPSKRLQVEDLIGFGTMTKNMANFLQACIVAKLNIIVAGGTGSGKTTLLNVLSSFIPKDERIITIEDSAELQLSQPHVVGMETAPPDVDGSGKVTIRDLVMNSLRMRPDRLVIGEVRGGEALDLLQAMNTGHDGSLATVHANAPRDVISRLETLALESGVNLPVDVIRKQISSAINLIIMQNRLRDGSRKITQITEIQGMEGNTVTLQDVFVYRIPPGSNENKGNLEPTNIKPNFMPRLVEAGFRLSNEVFLK